MFSKKFAGIGAVAALVGSALVPSFAFADDTTDPDATAAQQLQPAAVAVNKTVVDNASIDNSGDSFTVTFTASPCAADGCVASGIPAIGDVTLTPGDSTSANVSGFMPAVSAYNNTPGVYQWEVVETQQVSPATNQSEIVFSKAKYRVKAYMWVNPNTNQFEYKAVTIAQDQQDAETVVANDPAVKVTSLDFTNRYTTLTNFQVQKNVVNDSGLTEAASYNLTVEFTWPTNITSDPGIAATGYTCTPDTTSTPKKTSCSGTIAKDATVNFTNVPVGAGYTVSEVYDPDTDTFVPSYSSASGTVTDAAAAAATDTAAAVNFVTVTNTYEPTTPTGVVLAVLPYVLMIGIPLLAIAGYIALRRKMNL